MYDMSPLPVSMYHINLFLGVVEDLIPVNFEVLSVRYNIDWYKKTLYKRPEVEFPHSKSAH